MHPVVRTALHVAPWVGVGALAAWLGLGFETLWLVPATAGFLAPLLVASAAHRSRAGRGALLAGVALVVAAFLVEGQRRSVVSDWEAIRTSREDRVALLLEERLDALLRDGRAAVATLARASAEAPPPLHLVQRLRRGGDFDAAAVYGADGGLVVWDGLHRGAVPTEVTWGTATYQFGSRPLARYLYVTEPIASGGTAVLARLLDSDLPPPVRRAAGDLAIEVESEVDGISLRFSGEDRVAAGRGSIFDYGTGEATLVSVRIETISAAGRIDQIERETRRWGAPAVLLLWVVLAATLSGRGRGAGAAIAAGLLVAALLPLRNVALVEALASPADALLAGRPLGRWLWVAALGCVVVPALRRPATPRRLPRGTGIAAVALGVPAVAALVEGSLASGFVAPWLTAAGLVALGAGLVVRGGIELESVRGRTLDDRGEVDAPAESGGDEAGPDRRWSAGLVVVFAVATTLAVLAVERPGVPTVAAATAALPLLFWRRLVDGTLGREALAWALSFLVGASVALPLVWGARIEARQTVAETQMARLGLDDDPYLDVLLRDMARTADSLDAVGLRPVELLYQTWRASGLGEADYPIHLTLWLPSGVPREDLRIGALPTERPSAAFEAFAATRPGAPPRVETVARPWAHYVLSVPLDDGRVLTGVVPPLRELGRATLLGPLFESLDASTSTPLTLIPQQEEDPLLGEVVWSRSSDGWSGEYSVRYPESDYHAHWELTQPPLAVVVARGTLLAALFVAVGMALVGLGVLLFAAGLPRGRRLRALVDPLLTFRTRITVALFLFFAASNVVFGSLAYRTIEGASRRAAELLATRAADEAAQVYLEVDGVIDFLAQRVGTEVLEYRDGGLREGSIEPLVELGLYEGWVPFEVQRELGERERTGGLRATETGPWRYVTAYGRLPDGDVVGAPVPLDAGADAVRQAEVRDLLAFAILAGAGLSLLVALAAGRALARPISTLRIASERVGSGNLEVRLPAGRPDEFGAVFDAFNRMVARLRQARRNLVRTNRRTRAIVAEAATGVIAVDDRGVVSLVNERARMLLGVSIEEGTELRAPGLGEIGGWLDRYLLEGPREASTELQVGERRIRLRVRRIGEGEEAVGAVFSLEDVTDELRTERVLAWGEMARQVAHEVKNPLTPIKLSLQHVQRAWRDGRSDFGDILERNADAMLREIDRLADIASSFSRLGAPEAAGTPLEALDLAAVVDEVLTLYRGGQGSVAFRALVASDLPPVRARRSEMKEVLVNLLENARTALGAGGTVDIRASRDREDVLLAVVDDGPGIDESLLARVFEPHFSTRSTGTGLGLAIVQRLVESWEGEVTLSSVTGTGTTVILRLRAAPRG